jgi:uncharacterized membrane protein
MSSHASEARQWNPSIEACEQSLLEQRDIDVFSVPWLAFARSIGATFTLLLGLSLAIRRAREDSRASSRWPSYVLRGAQIFGLGMVVTLATYLAIGSGFVVFGILHLQGLALLLAYPFTRVRSSVTIALAIGIISVGAYLNGLAAPFPWLIWLGLPQQGRQMVDYYPLLPWFGAALLGVVIGKTLYPGGERRFDVPDFQQLLPIRMLRFLGRHSLATYLLHQPVLIGVLMGLGLGSF